MVEGCPGFAVVLHPKNSALCATTRDPAVVFERLSKEDIKVADGPLNLLQTMDIRIFFRKVLTRKL